MFGWYLSFFMALYTRLRNSTGVDVDSSCTPHAQTTHTEGSRVASAHVYRLDRAFIHSLQPKLARWCMLTSGALSLS